MSIEHKVVWNEGTLIAPQHFQQTERYYDSLVNHYYAVSHAYGWGIQELVFDLSALKLGAISIDRVIGFFKDGSFFNGTLENAPNLTLNVPPNTEDEYIYLVWAASSSYKQNYGFIEDHGSELFRYILKNVDCEDHTDLSLPKRELLVASPNLRLSLGNALNENEAKLAIAKISSVSSTGEIFLDESFIPSTLNCHANTALKQYQSEIMGLLKQKAMALTGVLNNPNLSSAGDVRDFLMLQTINRYYAYMHSVTTTHLVHPFIFFENLLKLYGDLSTFNLDKSNFNLPVYDHDRLNTCFKKIVLMLREVLSIVLQQRAMMIPLELRDEATRVAITPDPSLLTTCRFVLAINASLPSDALRQRIPTTIKISSVEKVRDLIAYHLPGIHVHALSTAPRELPYHSGFSYFEISKDSELWDDLSQSSGMAIHLAGEFPDLVIECWAIKTY
ncbi:type VI secretion system baseplate subunit TssK [Acinetobacter rudis]|uniref:Type VI secretion protein n=1 Tax=Acinetobacter rudis CIP 110305 TaxID=421052 RepID=S3N3L5_9GAMM|nr:type VI secretion system baseplate subunit TssK [Acinetobacter rudis]EPF74372.1 type VI secretion protein [Acinetobacter rudis CIP 110305]